MEEQPLPEHWYDRIPWWGWLVGSIVLGAVVLGALGSYNRERDASATAGTPDSAALSSPRVQLDLVTCGRLRSFGSSVHTYGARGLISHSASERLDIFIEIDFRDADGVVREQSNDWIRGLAPGDTAQWEARSIDFSAFAACEPRVRSVFEAD